MKDTKILQETILKHLRPGLSIGIMSHVEPDGDGFCASLALQHFLRSRDLASVIVTDDSDLERFSFLMQGADVRQYQSGMRFDLLFVLDCNSYIRIGDRAELVRGAGFTILVDHHVPENGVIAGDYSFVDTSAASVGAILFRAFEAEIKALPEDLRISIANCLYVTLLNDTNNFINANTDREVFLIAAELTACGISPYELYKAYFLNHDPLELRYIGEVLSTIELYHHNRVLYMYSTLDMQRRNDLRADSIMNITRWVQGVNTVQAIAYLREEAPDVFKLSLRSPVLNVNAIASSYGGGGHVSASGATVRGDLNTIKSDLLARLGQALDEQRADA
ncbi:MAG: DHH family phosphoesterase [Candidatus Syntrophosphaera sp.]|nr:DHH family phosphoesterase [Candidatus Syntrophosphaera sp.]